MTRGATCSVRSIMVSVDARPGQSGRSAAAVLGERGWRWLLPVFAVSVVALGVVMALGTEPLPLAMLVGVETYLVSSRASRQVSIGAAGAAAIVLCGALLYSALARADPPSASDAAVAFLPLVAAWFVGDATAARRRYLAGLDEQAERERSAEIKRARSEVQEERMRIAHELHDVVAHTLAVITVQAGVGLRLMKKRPEEGSRALESIEVIGRTAQDELRVVLGLLRDKDAETAALVPAPQLVDLRDLIETVRASGTPVELRTSGIDRPLSPALELSIYRVIQEALTNVVKHAPGARATVDLEISAGSVRVDVIDGGGPTTTPASGEEVRTASWNAGHGLLGMRERVGAFGGSLVAEPLDDGGFRVLARLPIDGAS